VSALLTQPITGAVYASDTEGAGIIDRNSATVFQNIVSTAYLYTKKGKKILGENRSTIEN
jgi:hypothetical protein